MPKAVMTPADWVQRFLHLQGGPFDIKDYPYLDAIYNCPHNDILLATARQVSKSTTLASMLVEGAVNCPNSSQVLVSPLQEQANVFSMTRLREFIHESPLIKNLWFTGAGVVDQVLRKQFNNGSQITLGYAQRTADRLRGRSIVAGPNPKSRPILGFDETQDIVPDVVPVIKEMAFRVPEARYLYAGTPKSMAGHLQLLGNSATGNEWAVRCPETGCKKWNHRWTERNIGNTGVICEFCGKPLDTRNGQWVSTRKLDLHKGKDASVTRVSFRIPQLIVHPIMSNPAKWIELLGKLRTYSTEKFYNEVLGLPYDSASQPITREQLLACCSERRNHLPDPSQRAYPPLVIGLDWAFVAEKSYTFVVIGAWDPFPQRFRVYYWKRYAGVESDSLHQIREVIDFFNRTGARLIGADWGAGHVQNIQLVNALTEDCVAQMWHTGMQATKAASKRAKWEPKTRKWHLARTAVLTDTFEHIRRGQIEFPAADECSILFDNLLAVSMEYNEKTNTSRYVNIEPDDGLHALTYAMLAGELLAVGDFHGHQGMLANDPGYMSEDDGWQVGHDYYT